jgi:hypothetical protein
VNPEDGGTSFPFSSESVVNIETRGMKPDQESSSLSKGLLVDSMAMALLLEVNDILEQERCASTVVRIHAEKSLLRAPLDQLTGYPRYENVPWPRKTNLTGVFNLHPTR